MAKQSLMTDRQTQWAKDKADLERDRQSYWDYIATIMRIVDSGTYLEQYHTQDEFLKEEAGFGASYFSRLRSACEARQGLLTIGQPPSTERALREIAKIPDKKLQKKAFAEASEKAESEGREVTTSDLRKAAKKYIPEPETNGKPKADKPAREVGDEPPEMTEADVDKWFKLEKSKWIKTLEAMMRGIDELNNIRPNPGQLTINGVTYKDRHEAFLRTYHQAHGLIKGWK